MLGSRESILCFGIQPILRQEALSIWSYYSTISVLGADVTELGEQANDKRRSETMPAHSEIVPGADLSIEAITTERRDMNFNRSALDVLARDGISVTEGVLNHTSSPTPTCS